jgi:hypothetical protein
LQCRRRRRRRLRRRMMMTSWFFAAASQLRKSWHVLAVIAWTPNSVTTTTTTSTSLGTSARTVSATGLLEGHCGMYLWAQDEGRTNRMEEGFMDHPVFFSPQVREKLSWNLQQQHMLMLMLLMLIIVCAKILLRCYCSRLNLVMAHKSRLAVATAVDQLLHSRSHSQSSTTTNLGV